MATWIKAGFWEKLCKPCQGYKGWLNLDQLIESMIPAPAYRVYTALLTQSGGNQPDDIFGGNGSVLDYGQSFLIFKNPDNYDLTIFGAENNNEGTWFVCNSPESPILPYTNSLQLKVNYGAPVVTVLENTIGNIWFSRQADGTYRIDSSSLFLSNKTYVSITDNRITGDPSTELRIIKAQLANEDAIYINTIYYNIDGGWNGGGNQDDILNNTPIEIRVYN